MTDNGKKHCGFERSGHGDPSLASGSEKTLGFFLAELERQNVATWLILRRALQLAVRSPAEEDLVDELAEEKKRRPRPSARSPPGGRKTLLGASRKRSLTLLARCLGADKTRGDLGGNMRHCGAVDQNVRQAEHDLAFLALGRGDQDASSERYRVEMDAAREFRLDNANPGPIIEARFEIKRNCRGVVEHLEAPPATVDNSRPEHWVPACQPGEDLPQLLGINRLLERQNGDQVVRHALGSQRLSVIKRAERLEVCRIPASRQSPHSVLAPVELYRIVKAVGDERFCEKFS
jgi:hypothetical protein